MKKLFALFILFGFFFSAYACLNEYHVNRSGKSTIDYFAMHKVYFLRGFDTVQLNKEIKDMQALEKSGTQRLYTQNNIAVKLIKLGRLQEAYDILQGLLKDNPNEYNVIINLGTLYELMGKDEEALRYIKLGIKTKPTSHNGSEWFHEKVLEAKLNNYDAAYLTSNKLLQLNLLKKRKGVVVENVLHQLHERIPFTPTPNLAMANILNEFGDYLADSVSITGASVIYNIALEYNPEDVFSIKPKLEEIKKLTQKYKVKYPNYKHYFVTVDEEYYKKKKNGQRFNTLFNDAIKIGSKVKIN